MTETGVFTLSLDTELAWGSFDKDGVSKYGEAYRETPRVVERTCELFDEYNVTATWAFVTHLFTDCDGHETDGGAAAYDSGRRSWLARAPCSTGVQQSLWYAPEMLATVRDCKTTQDIGLHGFSHLVFGDHSRVAAKAELTAAVTAAREVGVDPSSFVYPRNEIAHTDLLARHGINVFRGRDARWYEHMPFAKIRKPLRFVDEVTVRPPSAVTPSERDGVVCLPGSQIFRPRHGPWAWTPAESQAQRARKGMDRAVETGGVFHLWWHPFNLAGDVDSHLAMLEDILAYMDSLRADDELEIMSMSDVATAYRGGRWQTSQMEGVA